MSIELQESNDKDVQRQNYYRACMNQFQTLGYLEELDQFNRKDNGTKPASLNKEAKNTPR